MGASMKPKHKSMYMKMAHCLADVSIDEKLKVGCVIVKDNNIIATGYNGKSKHLSGANQDSTGKTFNSVRHAEKNALMSLIRSNESAVGATMFVTHGCCVLCGIDVVDAGIIEVIYEKEYKCSKGLEYLEEHGVKVSKLGAINKYAKYTKHLT